MPTRSAIVLVVASIQYGLCLNIPFGNISVSREDFMQTLFRTSSLMLAPKAELDWRPLATNAGFWYSPEWSGTSLPLLSLSDAVAQATEDASYRWPMGRWPDPILRRQASPVARRTFGTKELDRACLFLEHTAKAEKAVGLAAQQCGVDARIVFLERPRGALSMVNPRIVQRSPETEMKVWVEQCLVLPPSFAASVLRDAWIDVEYQDKSTGRYVVVRLHGELARAAQHELDHDRGILVTDHIGFEEMENDVMRKIEAQGHDSRMLLAYARTTADATNVLSTSFAQAATNAIS